MLLMNEKIKASEVALTGLDGEDLGIVSRDEALSLARQAKADLVCTSLLSSPPPCRLTARGAAKQTALQEKRAERVQEGAVKTKEIRLTAQIEDHDYDTKLRQSEKLLASGHAVLLTVKLAGAKEGAMAKELLERMLKALASLGERETGIQVSGKQVAVKVKPR
ncbi:translation initiation factor IF-3 [Cohnella sp. JJ-181]|uniref:translation initiation factor IF-3 n=1 Tax=Cohnella rhizoplanae TaxID=2974897 RepID=UPI0022FF4ECF|nr:translation initiation factor IF-3 [Cohnella sp. JJ-181]CAI6070005.1 Translation initiation factor IF-3 [Cohnella sp. JJ-181]